MATLHNGTQSRDGFNSSRFAGLSTAEGSSGGSSDRGNSGRRSGPSSFRSRTQNWSLSVSTNSSGSGDGQDQARYIGSGGRRRNIIRYSKLELLQLYQPSSLPEEFEDPDNFVTSTECREPLNKTFFKMDKDAKINPDFVIARGRGVPAGGPSSSSASSRGGRGGASIGRGRGRGRGAPLSPSGNDSMPAWATETVDREDRSFQLRGFTDEEKDNILTPQSSKLIGSAGTAQVSSSVFDDTAESPLEDLQKTEEHAPLQQESQIVGATQTSNTSNEIDFSSLWLYKDNQGGIHGPFSLEKLNSWVDAAFFDPVIEVKQEGDSSFRILKDVIETANATEQRRRRIEMGLPAEEEKLMAQTVTAGLQQTEQLAMNPISEMPTEEQLLREQHISVDSSSPIKSILDVIDEQRPAPTQQHWGQQNPYLQQTQFGVAQGMIPPTGMEQYYYGVAGSHPAFMQQHTPQPMYSYQQYMMQQPQQQQAQMPLSADQLEQFILQGGTLPTDAVPQQQAPQFMAQLQQMQQYYWMQQQQQQFYAQQQQLAAVDQEQQQPQQPQSQLSQIVAQPQQQAAVAQVSTSQELNPFDQTNKVEETPGEWKESTGKKTTAEQQKAQPGQKPQQQQQQAAKPTQQKPAQSATVQLPPQPAQPKPHAVPAKSDAPKPVEQTQKPQAKVVEAKGDEFDESQFIYDRENKKVVGSAAVPQSKGWSVAPATGVAPTQPQIDTTGLTLAEIQQQQDKERRKQLKKEQEQLVKEMEARNQPVWGGAGAAQPQLSLLDIQNQEKVQGSSKSQASSTSTVNKGPITFASKVSKQTASSVPAPTSPSVWGSASSQGKSLKEIQDEEKRQSALEKKRVQNKAAAGTLAEQLAKNAKGAKGQTGLAKPALPSAAPVAQTVSPTNKQKGTAIHYNDEEEEHESDDEVAEQEDESLWDYTGNAKVESSAFSSNVGKVATASAAASSAPTVGIAGAESSSSNQKKASKNKGSSFAGAVGGSQNDSLDTEDFPTLRPASLSNKKKGKSTSAEANAFGVKDVSENLQQWFKKEVTSTLGQKYEPTMLYFLMSVETDAEVDAYVQEYFGTSNNAKKFGQQFKAYRDFEHNGGTGPFNPAQAVANKQKQEQDEFKQATKKRGKGAKITL